MSEYAERAAYQNRFEPLHDPSHTCALSISAFLGLFTACGLEVEQLSTDHLDQAVEQWLANAHTPNDLAQQARAPLEQDNLHDLSGTHPFIHQGATHFRQRTALLMGRKLAVSSYGSRVQRE